MRLTRRSAMKGGVMAGSALLLAKTIPAPRVFTSASAKPSATPQEEFVPTNCWIGKQNCGMVARRVNGRVIKLEGLPAHPRNQGTLCPKGVAQIMALYDPNRVKTPLIRTNQKGVHGQWRQASWEEALTLVAQRIREVRDRDKRLILWQKGRSKSKAFYDSAFVNALGATLLHHAAFCSEAVYQAAAYTIGLSGGLNPDFRYTRYILAWGWNVTNAGGNMLCWITWPQMLIEAKERGAKLIAIDPRLRGAAHFADEWVPIRPASDLALALALSHTLIELGYVDREYLTRYTNAPFLVDENGFFLRHEGRELVWDTNSESPQPFDAPGVQPALEGSYMVDGRSVQTAYELFKQHVASYTPEWAATVCGVPAETIRRIARELGEHAQIGSSITIDGVNVPYRPVGVMAYHVAQQELGFQAMRAVLTVFMLLGAIGAAGGVQADFGWKIHPNYKALDEVQIKDPPYNIWLKDSKFFPINSNSSAIVARVMLEPEKYGVDYLPEVLIIHMSNPVLAFGSQPDIIESYKKFKFIVVIDPWLSETADLFADVVLPAATLEKYEGPISASTPYIDAVTLLLPVMEPLFQSRGEPEIYLDLCEKLDILYGPGGYLDELNKALKLKDPYKLPLDRKPSVREILDRWARSQGLEEGLAYFERNGVWVKGPIPPSKRYGYVTDPPFGGVRHRLYGESLLRYRQEMQSKGASELYWRDYTPFPTWRPPTMESSPSEYDLYLISYKLIEFKQSRSSFIPLLAEQMREQRLVMNPATAQAKGIRDGEEVWVESHNAITGETRRIRAKVAYREGIRPDTVGLAHHYGHWTHPWAKGQGPSASELLFTGEGYVANTADQSFHVKVRVYK